MSNTLETIAHFILIAAVVVETAVIIIQGKVIRLQYKTIKDLMELISQTKLIIKGNWKPANTEQAEDRFDRLGKIAISGNTKFPSCETFKKRWLGHD